MLSNPTVQRASTNILWNFGKVKHFNNWEKKPHWSKNEHAEVYAKIADTKRGSVWDERKFV